MNEYKRAWMMAVDLLPEVQFSDSKPNTDQTTGQTVYDHVKSDIVTGIAASVMMAGFKHMAQSQLKNRLGMFVRTSGKIGLRAVTIIGTAMAVNTVYTLVNDLLD